MYATRYSAGLDLIASEEKTIAPHSRALVNTDYVVDNGLWKDNHYVGLVCQRSGMALKHGITVLNAPGIIDADYEGDVGVILYNTSDEDYYVGVGDKVAQLVVTNYEHVAKVAGRTRGSGGFGSTDR